MNKKEEIKKPKIKTHPKITPKRRTDKELSPDTWEIGVPGPQPKF